MDIIKYPKRESEAEVQSLLWMALRKKEIDARLQVIGNLNGKRHKFDIVTFKDSHPQSIIECKSWARYYSKDRLYQPNNTAQIRKYEAYGLPVFICGRSESIPNTTKLVLSSFLSQDFQFFPEV